VNFVIKLTKISNQLKLVVLFMVHFTEEKSKQSITLIYCVPCGVKKSFWMRIMSLNKFRTKLVVPKINPVFIVRKKEQVCYVMDAMPRCIMNVDWNNANISGLHMSFFVIDVQRRTRKICNIKIIKTKVILKIKVKIKMKITLMEIRMKLCRFKILTTKKNTRLSKRKQLKYKKKVITILCKLILC
jgi:hypothetical protein